MRRYLRQRIGAQIVPPKSPISSWSLFLPLPSEAAPTLTFMITSSAFIVLPSTNTFLHNEVYFFLFFFLTLYKLHHTEYILLYLAPFIYHDVCEMHSCCVKLCSVHSLLYNIPCRNVPCLPDPFYCWWILVFFFPSLDYCKQWHSEHLCSHILRYFNDCFNYTPRKH